MSDRPVQIPTPTPPGGGATYGQNDFSDAARRSKAHTDRDESAPTRSPVPTREAPKPAG